jgi:hypothetical protein
MKKTIFNTIIELQYRIESFLVAEKHLTDETFYDNKKYSPIFDRSYKGLTDELVGRFERLQKKYGNTSTKVFINSLISLLKKISFQENINTLALIFRKIVGISNKYVNMLGTGYSGYAWCIEKDDRYLQIIDMKDSTLDNNDLNYPRLDNNNFINLVSGLSQKIRHEDRQPTLDEYIAIQIGFNMISIRGYTDAPIVPWGNSGFRKVQTQASITDPGLGHITGTAQKMNYLNGTNVHIEFLERGSETNREKVEPYRLPDLATIGKVKLLIGKDTSVSSYVGRPMFEDSFNNSFIKTVHTTVAVCSAIFMNGLSECKVAIERMTVTQAIKFMKAVSANVVRDHNLQVLAAAFCVNYPLIDDRPETMRKNGGHAKKITDRMKIAKLGIEITRLGNFEKVTFDGTANWYPSDPIMEQLGYENALKLVHSAHEQGLLTYFSAGFRFRHLPDIVLSGTDGIGLRGAQILRFMDHQNGNQGPFKDSNIKRILAIDKKTASSVLGQGTQLLCRLDRMYYELSLPVKLDMVREVLFKELLQRNEEKVQRILSECVDIVKLNIDLSHPLVAWGDRLLRFNRNCLAFRYMTKQEKTKFMDALELNIQRHDYDQLDDILQSIQERFKEVQGSDKEIHLVS